MGSSDESFSNTNSEVGSLASKAESLILRNIPEPQRLWIGEVEDGKSIGELITSAFITGRPILDTENLDFKIASGLRKIRTGNFKKQVTTAEGTAQSETRSLAGRQVAWMIYDFSKIFGDKEGFIKSSVEERQRSSLRQKVGRSTTSSHSQTH